MNPTKNVKYIEVEQDLFRELCEVKYDEIAEKIQGKYTELKETVNSNVGRWEKMAGEDLYLETGEKILFPDTRKLKPTYLKVFSNISYKRILEYFHGCDKETLEKMEKQAESKKLLIPSPFDSKLHGLKAKGISKEIAYKLFRDGSCPCLNNDGYLESENGYVFWNVLVTDVEGSVYNFTSRISKDSGILIQAYTLAGCDQVSSTLKISVVEFPKEITPFDIFVQHGLYPENFNEKWISLLKVFHDVVKKNVNIEDKESLKSYLKDKKTEKLLDFDLRAEAIENEVEAEEIDITAQSGIGMKLRTYLDECDYSRGRIQKYHTKWYQTEEGKGHWELWGSDGRKGEKEKVSDDAKEEKDSPVCASRRVLRLAEGVVARNPVADVRHDAVVGIDFGTKSTIVALQDGDEQIVPLRVGMADYSVTPETFHFENPTVMQFIDMGRFWDCYNRAEGRPMTSWDDLRISHEAFKSMIGAKESVDFAAFFTDLKQWAAGRYGSRKRDGHLIIKDKKGHRFDFNNYMELTEEDIDPIEIYAYYIGLFINNMHTGIYLDYLMSFPETFSIEVKERILGSFREGIRKSLPAAVLEDAECKAEFRVRQGPSEPAAYAACALEQYQIEPTDDGVFYGIFDFGGGTTDYDFGIWKNGPEDEYTYNYVIKHYGSGGDKTLGGENILQLIAYYVFSDNEKYGREESNQEIMRKNRLAFFRPGEGKVYSGMEALNNDGESAVLNTKQMMEALRPVWEEWETVREWFHKQTAFELDITENVSLCSVNDSDGSYMKARLLLFSESGRVQAELVVSMGMVNRIIDARIESGVRNFFESLASAYGKCEKKTGEKIHLFLAGNSSRSKRVQKIFREYMVKYNALIFGGETEDMAQETVQGEASGETEGYVQEETGNQDEDVSNTGFLLYPPLGTSEARKIQKNFGMEVVDNDLMSPTGKTGVAFGLVMCREGSMIRVESEIGKSEQIKLNYYIGVNYRKHFKMIFDRSAKYNTWLKFSKVAAGTETFEFYYTELPEVVDGSIDIKGNQAIYKHKNMLDNVNADAGIYFRFLNPSQLEYVAALDDKIGSDEYMSKIYRVKL